MPVNYDRLNERAKEFNAKYRTVFTYAGFLAKVRTFKNLNLEDSANVVYKGTLAKVLMDVMINACANERTASKDGIGAVDLQAVVEEFEYFLMQPFIQECKNAKERLYPKSYGGMKESERIEFIESVVNSSPKNDVELAEKAYKNGDIRIRDMREYVNEIDLTEGISAFNLRRIGAFMLALENVNKGRSFWWRVFHPVRNNAEKREAREMRTLLSSFRQNALERAKELAMTEYGTISLTKESLRAAKAEKDKNREAVSSARDNVQVDIIAEEKHEVSEKVTVNEKDTLVKSKNV